MAIVVYLVAGLFAAWSYPRDAWWQRCLWVPLWMPLFAYGLFCEAVDWWNRHGFHYPTDDDDEEPPSQEWHWP
jgi:hypothetical protein